MDSYDDEVPLTNSQSDPALVLGGEEVIEGECFGNVLFAREVHGKNIIITLFIRCLFVS